MADPYVEAFQKLLGQSGPTWAQSRATRANLLYTPIAENNVVGQDPADRETLYGYAVPPGNNPSPLKRPEPWDMLSHIRDTLTSAALYQSIRDNKTGTLVMDPVQAVKDNVDLNSTRRHELIHNAIDQSNISDQTLARLAKYDPNGQKLSKLFADSPAAGHVGNELPAYMLEYHPGEIAGVTPSLRQGYIDALYKRLGQIDPKLPNRLRAIVK